MTALCHTNTGDNVRKRQPSKLRTKERDEGMTTFLSRVGQLFYVYSPSRRIKKSRRVKKLPFKNKKDTVFVGQGYQCFSFHFQFSTRSLEPSFGLLFKDLLDDLNVHTTGASVIASTLDSVVNFSGFFVGPVIKTFSYRKVCFVGSLICAMGLLFTAPANSMGHILATYSILGGKKFYYLLFFRNFWKY